MIDPGLSHFCFYLAYLGQSNYISREVGERAPYKSYYAFSSEDDVEGLKEYAADKHFHPSLPNLKSRPSATTATIATTPDYKMIIAMMIFEKWLLQ